MPRPLIYADHLRELPAGAPLDVGAAQTPAQALTPGQIIAGANVTVSWENGVLTISAGGTGGAGESVSMKLAGLVAAAHTMEVLKLFGAGSGLEDSGVAIKPAMAPVVRDVPDYDGLPDVAAGADFAWIMTTGGVGVNQHAFTVMGEDAGAWAGSWRTYGNWRGLWVYRHRDDPARLCFYDPETSAWTFALWPGDSVFPGYPEVWNSRAGLVYVSALSSAEEPPETGWLLPNHDPPDFEVDYQIVPLTGDETVVANAAAYGLDGAWVAVSGHPYYGDRVNGMRFYARKDGGEGCIYFESWWNAWVLSRWGRNPGDGYPQLISSGDYAADPNNEYLAPKSSGYYDWDWGNPVDATVTVVG